MSEPDCHALVQFENFTGQISPAARWATRWRFAGGHVKIVTHSEKDAGHLVTLRRWFAERGENPPSR